MIPLPFLSSPRRRTRPPNHLRSWAPEEISELKHLISDGASIRDIARMLGRTQAAVSGRARIEKLSRKGPSIAPT